MNRRDLIKALAAAGALGRLAAQTPDSAVKRVLVMFKCHLDVGFTDTQAAVMRKYFDVYFPLAMERARAMRASGGDRYIWTTGSWLVYECLEQAKGDSLKRMEQALSAGDLAWHALPFSWQTEVLDRSLITGAIGFSKSLDGRFGKTTTGAKMTDVPGHSVGIIAPLSANGVKLLDIGVNSASTPPDVPPLFVWKDSGGASVVMMYHRKEYGGVVVVPGSDLAVAVEMANDNSGPHSIEEIRRIYADLRKRFPGAAIQASNLSQIANAVDAYRANLPVVTEEIGDTWIHGIASDPVKLARYREVARLRREWIAQGKIKAADATDVAFLRRFSLAAEHTWGTDTKSYLDHDHYKPADLEAVLDQPGYRKMTTSWVEKRNNIDAGVASLPAALRAQAIGRLQALKPLEPQTAGLKAHRAGDAFESEHFTIAIDPETGAIRSLRNKANGRDWASPDHPLGLFSYQTFSKQDYDRFLDSYVLSKEDWAPQDFGKPNIDHFGAKSGVWFPKLKGAWSGASARGERLLASLEIDDAGAERSGLVAWPRKLYLELILPKAEPAIELNFYCFDKIANRLPEAMWLTFQPNVPEPQNWMIEKCDAWISPFSVIRGGNRHMHAISRGMRYQDSKGSLSIDTLDAPAAALGVKSPIYFSYDQPDIAQGIHFSLYNNGWGTNYIQWWGEDVRFRFVIRA